MATTSTSANAIAEAPHAQRASAALVVSLPSLARDSFDQIVSNLAAAFPAESLVVATPDASAQSQSSGLIQVVGYTPTVPSPGSWTLVAADFLNAHELAQQHSARAVLLLGGEAQTLTPEALHALASSVLDSNLDLAVPRYTLPIRAGLVNSAILYPISRALFGATPRFPLAIDLGLSARMAERLATTAQRFTAANQPDAMIWPIAEAATGSFVITQVDAGSRTLPQPEGLDLNTVLAQVTGSLFADVDAKAAFWQRSRIAQPSRPLTSALSTQHSPEDIKPMLDAFRLAYTNLHEIWSLVLPPHSLLGLKRLSIMPAESFVLQDSLWARIVYDFLLAYRLRTINRGHLLGALTPLYLAWVASHIQLTGSGTDPDRHIEACAAAFEADKPYLVSRWRWPDRFNP